MTSLWDVTTTGFLPHLETTVELTKRSTHEALPLRFDPFLRLVAKLPEILASKTLSDALSELPVLEPECFADLSEIQRELLFVAFSFLANASIHSRACVLNASPPFLPKSSASMTRSTSAMPQPRILPKCIAIPICALASSVGRRPIVDYASSVLLNTSLRTFSTLKTSDDNLETLFEHIKYTFTGSDSEKWFYAVHQEIERRGADAVSAILDSSALIDSFFVMDSDGDTTQEDHERQERGQLWRPSWPT